MANGTSSWTVERRQQILVLRLEGIVSEADMAAFVADHNAAVDAYAGGPYRVFCDIRHMKPLSPACAALFENAKAHSARQACFQGSAVVVASKVVAMQHERTSVASGVMATELISDDETACWRHLEALARRDAAPAADRKDSGDSPA